MKSFSSRQNVSGKRLPNFLIMLLAILAAVLMWYFVSKRDMVERQIEVGLDYYGIPQDLIITRGLVNKIVVRVRGPELLMRSLPQENLQQGINLSNIKIGETRVPFGDDKISPKLRAFTIIDISPARIDVFAERLVEHTVPIKTNVISPLEADAITYKDANSNPSSVRIRGPESVINKISYIPLTIRLDPKLVGTTQEYTETLDTPNFVTAIPASVTVTYTITSTRATLNRRCPIVIAGNSANLYEVYPSELDVSVDVPEKLVKDEEYLNQLEATVAPPAMEQGQSIRLRLRFRLPEGMTLKAPYQQDVIVTRKIDNASSNT